MTGIIFGQTTGYCDFATLTYTINHASLSWWGGRKKGASHLWCHHQRRSWGGCPVSPASLAFQVCGLMCSREYRKHLVLSCWCKRFSAKLPVLHLLRCGRGSPRLHPPPWSCDGWRALNLRFPPPPSALCSPQKETSPAQPAHLRNSFPVLIWSILPAVCLNPLHLHKSLEFLNLELVRLLLVCFSPELALLCCLPQ